MTTWEWTAMCFACVSVGAMLGLVIGGFVRGSSGRRGWVEPPWPLPPPPPPQPEHWTTTYEAFGPGEKLLINDRGELRRIMPGEWLTAPPPNPANMHVGGTPDGQRPPRK